MGSYNEWFPSNYFKADDLDDGPFTLTITKIEPEKMQTGELKPCVNFKEDKRRLVLNKTNKDTLVLLTRSTDPKAANGLKVVLTQVPATYAGKVTKGIRITSIPAAALTGTPRSKTSAAKAAPRARPVGEADPDPDLNDEIPY